MEAILVMPSPDRGREFVLPLSLSGIRVRTVIQSGAQLMTELQREPAECIILPELLPDGPAEHWLAQVAAGGARRPVGVVLIYGVDGAEAVRERVRAAYGPTVDVVQAGARPADDVARDAGQLLERTVRLMADQDREAHERLRQPAAPSPVPQPVRRTGAIAFVGIAGGVGTSTLVANLAAHAALRGQKVLVVDAQFATGGSVMHYLGGLADEATKGLHHLRWNYMTATAAAAQRETTAAELLTRADEVRIAGARHGDLRVMQVPAILDQMLNMPAEQVVWGIRTLEETVDLLLVDCGSGLGDPRTRKILEAATRIMVVAGGWGGSVHALARGLSALDDQSDRANLRQRCFLLLREGSEGAYGARTVSSTVRMPIYGRVPDDPLVRRADGKLGARVPLVAEAADSAYAKSIAQVAFALGISGEIAGAAGGSGRRKGLFGFLSRR